ncbi:MAG TPA: HD domain-containing protein [Firmicutes bacterium]|nr:HD domain-containing protein [Bacillota bacterium]
MNGSSTRLNAYIRACVILGGLLLVVYQPFPLNTQHLPGLAVLGLLIFVSEYLAVPLPRGGGSVSVSSPLIYTAIIVYGIREATWLACVASISISELSARLPLTAFLFNRAAITISTVAGGIAYELSNGQPGSLDLRHGFGPLFVCALTYTAINGGLVLLAMMIQKGKSVTSLWVTNFRWSLPSLLAVTPLAGIMAFVLIRSGPMSIALFFLPLLAARHSFGRYVELRKVFIQTIKALVQTLDAKDPYTRGHSERVAYWASTIARKLNLPEQDIELLEYIGLLHDVGKIGISDAVLKKPGIYTKQEYSEMKAHPVLGAEIISGITLLGKGATWVKYHHERHDGTGFPEGLKGDDIPLGARIIAVADAFDAMTSDRPYKNAMSLEQAREELKRCSGSQFDPRIVQVMLTCTEGLQQCEDKTDAVPKTSHQYTEI